MSTTATAPPRTPPDPVLAENLAQWLPLIRREAGWWARRAGLDREELEQDIHLHAVRAWRSYDPGRGAFSTWLWCVARSAALRAVAARQRTVRAVSGWTGAGLRTSGDPADPTEIAVDTRHTDPAEVADRRLLEGSVANALAALTPAEREVLRLRFWTDEPITPAERRALARVIAKLRETASGPGKL